MGAPVQNVPPRGRRSRIVIDLDKAGPWGHPTNQAQQPYGVRKRKKWPIVLGIVGGVLLLLVVGGYFYWQSYKSKPAYSLALAIDAAQRGDSKAFDEVVDTEKIASSFAPQMVDEALGRLGTALTPAMRQRIERLIPTFLPRVRDTVHSEVMRHVKEDTARAAGKPFFLVALYLPYVVEIKQEGDTATITARLGERSLVLTMQRSGDQRWKIVGVKDALLARRLVDDVAKDLPAIGGDLGNDVLREIQKLPNIIPDLGGTRRR
ncbi:MAG: hypothetical protein QOJ64_723 [Acidobacteriota bacterium]|jgi:hypothetical protein|nr:hypothetical protein [Acidobacteriota bacterium]